MLDNLLDRLEGVRKSGAGWTARCSAHDDRRASLSFGRGEVRYEPKGFPQRRRDGRRGYRWNLQGVTPRLYHLNNPRRPRDGHRGRGREGRRPVVGARSAGDLPTPAAPASGDDAYRATARRCVRRVVVILDADDAGRLHGAGGRAGVRRGRAAGEELSPCRRGQRCLRVPRRRPRQGRTAGSGQAAEPCYPAAAGPPVVMRLIAHAGRVPNGDAAAPSAVSARQPGRGARRPAGSVFRAVLSNEK